MSIYKSDNIFERLDLSLLKHFHAIATYGGFSRASRATGLSQPALSLGLQKLEKELGVKLIDRKAGAFGLTESGKVLRTFCKRLEGTLESMVGDLGADEISVPRKLRIGTALSVGFGPLARACIESHRANAAMELELTAQNTYQLLADVIEGGLDAALVPDDVYDKRLRVTPLFRENLVFVQGAQAAQAPFSPRARTSGMIHSVLVTYPRETPMRSAVDKLCGQHDLRFRSVISVNGLDAILRLVKRGVGGAFVLRSLVLEELRRKELRTARTPFELPSSGIALVTAQGEHGDAIAKMLKRWF